VCLAPTEVQPIKIVIALARISCARTFSKYLVTWINKPMPCLDPQTPKDGVLTNKTAGIQGFVEVDMLETHFRAGVFLSYTRVLRVLHPTIAPITTGRFSLLPPSPVSDR
jgi:hypothetical protein